MLDTPVHTHVFVTPRLETKKLVVQEEAMRQMWPEGVICAPDADTPLTMRSACPASLFVAGICGRRRRDGMAEGAGGARHCGRHITIRWILLRE